jgi:two-component system chemotaxis response regulator CheY
MATQQGTLLIVEDFLLMRQIIKGFLRRMGYAHILEADHGLEALTRLRQQPIDLVLCDWELPQMDGLALLTAIRTDMQWCTMPFLMITAEATRDKVQAAIQAGANGYILKPFTRETFETKVTAMMARLPDPSG